MPTIAGRTAGLAGHVVGRGRKGYVPVSVGLGGRKRRHCRTVITCGFSMVVLHALKSPRVGPHMSPKVVRPVLASLKRSQVNEVICGLVTTSVPEKSH
ncbi:hypothetical protein KPB2_5580 [Klebsiella pneumoniae Kb677]|nr:hypothetical protein KPB2_5580 [Klebsiella pneumoniae Kb677]